MVTPSDVPRRRNGLSGPYSIPQISSWIFLSATSLQFLIFISTILPLEISIPLTIFFFSLVGLVLYFGMRAIAIDSMDVYLCKTLIEQQNTENGELFRRESKFLNRAYTLFNGDVETIKNQQFPENEETKQCWICDTQVAHHSMHCKYCNKCVSHFDHHCLWLNTCVGAKNYKDFFRVMICISAMQTVHMVVSLGLLVDIFLKGPTEDRGDDWLGTSGASEAVAAVLIFFVIFDFVSLVLLAQLIAFHVHLQRERITTYQYIVQDGQRRRERAKLQMELHQQRELEMARAREEGRSLYICRLASGDKFRQWGCGGCLDPLPMPVPEPEPDPNAGFAAVLGGNPTVTMATTSEQPNIMGDGEDDEEGAEHPHHLNNIHHHHDDVRRNVAVDSFSAAASSSIAEEHIDENGVHYQGNNNESKSNDDDNENDHGELVSFVANGVRRSDDV